MTADLLEGVMDVVSPPAEVDQAPYSPPVDSGPPAPEPEPVKEKAEPAPAEEKAEPAAPDADLEEAFAEAITRAGWVRRQDFKVLAIFWQARRRDLGPITAKAASALGGELDLVIRHENVRKVVRTRLKDRIETSTVPDSQPPTFQYEINDAGATFFEQEYLNNL